MYVRSGATWSQQAYLKPAAVGTTQANDQFGTSVAVAGDTVVVGARFESSSTTGIDSVPDESALSAGAAYVYVRSGATWSQQAYLKPATVGTTQANDNFGTSVAVSGDTVVIGAPAEDSSTTVINSTPDETAVSAGAFYVFSLATAPEIDVQQPALTSIPSGGSKGFGPVTVNATSDLVFTIANTGTSDLTLNGTPKVAVSGSSDFSVTAQPTSPVAASGTTTFTVRFAPTSAGLKTATLTTANDDLNEGTYTVIVTGTGVDVTPPVIAPVTLTGNNAFNPTRVREGQVVTLDFAVNEPVTVDAVVLLGTSASVVSTGVNSYRAQQMVTSGTPNGAAAFSITVHDAANNSTVRTTTSDGSTVTVDTVGPVVSPVSIASSNAISSHAKPGDTVTLNFTTSEATTQPGVVLLGTFAMATNVGGNTWQVSAVVTTDASEGPVAFAIVVSDVSGGTTVRTTTSDGSTVIVDKTAPVLAPVTLTSNNANNSTRAKLGNTVTLDFTTNEATSQPSVTLFGAAAVATNVGGNAWQALAIVTAGTSEGAVPFSITATDTVGNTATRTTVTAGSGVIVDKTPPIIANVPANMTVPAANATGAEVIFPEPTATDAIDGTIFVSCVPDVGSTFAIGTTTVDCTATDAAGNSSSASFTVTVGKIAQTITFNPPASVLTTATITLTATGGASGNPVTFNVQSGPGSIGAGNVLSFTGPGSVVVRASQTGNGLYEAAPDVNRTITVAEAGLTLVADTAFATGASVLINVLANDTAATGTLTLTNVTQPSSGTTKIEAGKVRFTPSGTVSAPITFSYTANNGTVTATTTVTVRPQAIATGTYVGLLRRADNSVRGRVVLTVTAAGALTGSLRHEGSNFTLKGSLNSVEIGVTGTGVIPRPFVVTASGLDALNQPILAMTLKDVAAGLTLTGTAERSPYSASSVAPQAGTYTMIAELPSGGTGPALAATMTCTVSADGTVKFGGKLGNNVAVTQAGKLLSGGRLPFYVSQATQRLGGEIVFDRTATPHVDGLVRWSMPNGADVHLPGGLEQDYEVLGFSFTPGLNAAAMFSPAAPTATLTLVIPSQGIGSPVVRSMTLTGTASLGSQKVNAPGVGTTALVFSTNTGLFTGTRTITGTVKRSFFGVVLQGHGINEGQGVLIEPTTLNPVTIVP